MGRYLKWTEDPIANREVGEFESPPAHHPITQKRSEAVQDFSHHDPQRLVENMTTVDGVILLASDPPGLTLSPAFVEDFDAWKAEVRRKRRSAYK